MDSGGLNLLLDLAVIMMVAGLVTLLFHWLRQPVILGYIIAGVLVGPYTPFFPFTASEDIVRSLADLGILLLMYSLGLEFSLRKLRRVGMVAVVGGALQVALVFVVAYQVGLLLGWGTRTSIFLGAALSISSTAIIIKVLEEMGRMRRRSSQIMFGILVFEDFAAVAMLVVLAGFGTRGTADLAAVGMVAAKLVLFAVLSIVLGSEVVPRLMDYAATRGRREMLVVLGLGLCFGLALLSNTLGLSVAAGAFIMGAIIAQARCSEAVAQYVAPIKDMFAALFFVAIGMLLNPAYLLDYWPHILLLTGVLIVGKVLAGGAATFLLGYPLRVALPVGLGLAQIGEFSLVIVKVGQDSGVVGNFLYPVVVGVVVLSALVSPYLIRRSDAVAARVERALPRRWQAYLTSLSAALERARLRAAQPGPAGRLMRSAIIGIFINVFILATLELIGRVAYENRQVLALASGRSLVLINALIPIAVVVVSLPSVVALARYIRILIRATVALVMRQDALASSPANSAARRLLRDVVLMPIVVLIGVVFHLGVPVVPGLPNLPLVVLGLAGMVVTLLVWDSIRAFHRRLEGLFWLRLTGGPDDEADSDEEAVATPAQEPVPPRALP